jgi:membrane protease YdiL (CAAX protease family)
MFPLLKKYFNRIHFLNFFYGLVVGLGLQAFTLTVILIWGNIEIEKTNPIHFLLPSLLAALFAAVMEEWIFRYLIFRWLLFRFNWQTAVCLSAVIFGVLHLFNNHVSVLSILSIMLQAGVLLPILYTYTNSLAFVIGTHFSWNSIQMAFLGTPTSGTKSFGSWLEVKFSGHDFITGGDFGVEASLQASFICLLVTSIIIWLILLRKD